MAGAAEVRLDTESSVAKIAGNEENSIMIRMRVGVSKKALGNKLKISKWR